MTPESAAFLQKAREFLSKAQELSEAHHWPDEAGRTAYLAAFHAAQAFIFETHSRVFKTHTGVHAEFARLVKDDPRVDDELRAFLGLAYEFKAIADYETGPSPKFRRRARRPPLKRLGGSSKPSRASSRRNPEAPRRFSPMR